MTTNRLPDEVPSWDTRETRFLRLLFCDGVFGINSGGALKSLESKSFDAQLHESGRKHVHCGCNLIITSKKF